MLSKRMITCSLFALVFVRTGDARAQSVVTVNWSDLRQTIDGFGVSQWGNLDPNGDYATILYNHAARSQIMDLAFSQSQGIGLTILRTNVPRTLQLTQGNWNYTDTSQVWLMQQAALRGPVKLIASVTSPPGWMKSNGHHVGGYVNSANYQDYANYLSRYAKEFAAANGVSIYALSMANEPNIVGVPWDTCTWSSAGIATFLANNLAPTFSANGVTTKVIAPETSEWNLVDTYLADTYANLAARTRVDIVAGHLYGGDPNQAFADYGKQIWQTEVSLRHPVWSHDGAMAYAKDIHDGLTNARLRAWLFYLLALWENDYSIIGLPSSTDYSVSKTFWAIGNYSKFVRPGYRRMGIATAPSGVDVTAFRDPLTDQFVIVAINRNWTSTPVNIGMQGFWTHVVTPHVTSLTQNLQPQSPTYLQQTQTLPARSIVTYVSRTRNFQIWANAPNAKAVSGDFNGDGRADIALVGGDGWTTVPVALSLGNGTFTVTNFARPDFALWANAPAVQVVVGDLNRDGRDDLIASGGAGWTTIPVAFSNGDGSFSTTNLANSSIPNLSRVQGAKLLSGDVNNDGRDDLLLTGGSGWTTIPVGLSNGNGTFSVSYWSVPAGTFTTWAQDPYAKASVTDLNADGRVDIVLTGGAGWWTVPVAFATSSSSFSVQNQSNSYIPGWSQAPGAKAVAGCRRTVPLPDHPTRHHCNF